MECSFHQTCSLHRYIMSSLLFFVCKKQQKCVSIPKKDTHEESDATTQYEGLQINKNLTVKQQVLAHGVAHTLELHQYLLSIFIKLTIQKITTKRQDAKWVLLCDETYGWFTKHGLYYYNKMRLCILRVWLED